MKKNLHDIDKLFHDAINEHEEMPSGEVWNNLENNLDKKDIASYRKKNNGLKRLSVLLLLLLSGVSLYVFLNKPTTSVASSNEKSTIAKNNTPIPSEKNNTEVKKEGVIAEDKIIKDNPKSISNQTGTMINNNIESNKTNNATIYNITPKILNQNKSARIPNNNSENNSEDNIMDNTTMPIKLKKNSKTTRTKIAAKISGSDIADNGEDADKNIVTNEQIDNNIIDTSNQTKRDFTIEKNKATSLAVAATKPTEAEKTSSVKKKDQNKKPHGFYLNAFYSPDFAFYHLKDDHEHNGSNPQPGDHHDEDKDDIDNHEDQGSAFTTGVSIDYNLNKHWSLGLGLTFSKTTISSNDKRIYAQLDNTTGSVKYKYTTSSGYAFVKAYDGNIPAVGDSIEAPTAIHTIQYLGIPLTAKYNFLYKKFEFYLTGSVSANILINGEIKASLKDNNEEEYTDKCPIVGLKKMYFTGSAGMGGVYNLNKKWAITLSPTVRFALTSINKNVGVRSYPNSFGIATGLRFKF